jgi:hypothetical protein
VTCKQACVQEQCKKVVLCQTLSYLGPEHLVTQTFFGVQLPKAADAAEVAEAAKLAQQRQAYEADAAVVRALRMALRDVTTRMLCDRRWRRFAEPVLPEEDPGYWEAVRLCSQSDVWLFGERGYEPMGVWVAPTAPSFAPFAPPLRCPQDNATCMVLRPTPPPLIIHGCQRCCS